MAEPASRSGGSESKNGLQPIIIVGSLIIVALVGVIVALILNPNRVQPVEEEEEAPPQRSYVINDDNIGDVIDEMQAPPVSAPQYYDVRMSMEWNFPDGTSPSSNAYVENVTDNTTDVYFDVELEDTGEIVYESPVIPLGGYLNNITLNRDLDPGSYDAVVIYHLIDEQQRTLSTVRMAIQIYVDG